jgi:hypothetical protein
LNAVASKEYVERLKMTVEHLYGCSARHLGSERVTETFDGATLWSGDVEAFSITGHPKASRCYGWSQGEPEEFITILEMPPIKSAHDAVKVALAYQVKQARKGK